MVKIIYNIVAWIEWIPFYHVVIWQLRPDLLSSWNPLNLKKKNEISYLSFFNCQCKCIVWIYINNISILFKFEFIWPTQTSEYKMFACTYEYSNSTIRCVSIVNTEDTPFTKLFSSKLSFKSLVLNLLKHWAGGRGWEKKHPFCAWLKRRHFFFHSFFCFST